MKLLYPCQGKPAIWFPRPILAATLIAASACFSSIASATDRTWLGAVGTSGTLFGTAANWSGNATPSGVTSDRILFSGTGVNTRSGQPEVVFLNTSVSTNTTTAPGLIGFTLTASQTTAVTIRSDPTFSSSGKSFRLAINSLMLLEAGSGSLYWDCDATRLIKNAVGPGTGGASITYHQFVNNNAPGGSVLEFGTGYALLSGGNNMRNIVFDGPGDIVYNGGFFFNQKSTFIKKGSGMLTLGGDSSSARATALAISTNPGVRYDYIAMLNEGTLNVNNAAALSFSGTFIISGGVINNTSGTAISIKNNPKIILENDLVFAGSNDLVLGAGQLYLTGTSVTTQRIITVSDGRLGFNGDINGAGIGITKSGAGTLVLGGTNVTYTGTISVTNGTLLANGSLIPSTVTAGSGATFGGSGTAGIVIIQSGGKLRAGDAAMIPSDPATMNSGTFTGTIGATYSTLTIDKTASASDAVLHLNTGAEIDVSIGQGMTNTKVVIANSVAAATSSVIFDNNIVKINDLTGGTFTSGTYTIFKTAGIVATDFAGITITGNEITAGLVAEIPSTLAGKLKTTDTGIDLVIYRMPTITCSDTMTVPQGWSFSAPLTFGGEFETHTVTGLPAGLSYNDTTRTIVGTPTATGDTIATITLTNPAITITKLVTISVGGSVPAPQFTIDAIIARPIEPFSYNITAINLPQSITAVSGMPSWMTLDRDSATGVWSISGTPPAGGGTWTIVLEAANPSGTTPFTLTVIVNATMQAPVITSAPSKFGLPGVAFNYQITADHEAAFYGVSGTLPTGITFNALTGAFAGTPTLAGTSTVTMHAINSSGTGSAPLSIEILTSMARPIITSSSNAFGYLNQGFSYVITGTPYVTSINVTDKPSWLSYDPATATLSGTCPGDGPSWSLSGSTYPVVVEASNLGGTGTGTINVLIKQYYLPPTVVSNTGTCYAGRLYNNQIIVTSTAGIESYSATGLPVGLGVNPVSGAISGRPDQAGNYTIIMAATTSGGVGTGTLSLNVIPQPPGPYISSPTTADAPLGQPFTYQITAETSVEKYGAVNMPPGLTLDTATGIISGTPSTPGYYQVEIRTTDSKGTYVATVTLKIEPASSTIITYAGALDTPGLVNDSGTNARFSHPSAAAIDASGVIYVADFANNAIRAIATDGTVSSYVTNIGKPAALAIDSYGNIYYADQQYNSIRKISAIDKTISTVAIGVPAPGGVAVDASDNVYFTESGRHVIRRISATDGSISFFAGSVLHDPGSVDDYRTVAKFNSPEGLAYNKAANILYIADTLNSTIRALDLTTNRVSTLAGAPLVDGYLDGVGAAARFHTPQGLAIDAAGYLYIADTGNSTIRVCDPKTGFVSTLIGKPLQTGALDGDGTTALLHFPAGIIADINGTGDIYVIDTENSAVRTLVIPPYIARPIVSATIGKGRSISLDGGAWGAPAPSYTWFKDGVAMTGIQSNVLKITSVTLSDSGTYQVVASSASGTTSRTMQLTVTTSDVDSLSGTGGGGALSAWFLFAISALILGRGVIARGGKR